MTGLHHISKPFSPSAYSEVWGRKPQIMIRWKSTKYSNHKFIIMVDSIRITPGRVTWKSIEIINHWALNQRHLLLHLKSQFWPTIFPYFATLDMNGRRTDQAFLLMSSELLRDQSHDEGRQGTNLLHDENDDHAEERGHKKRLVPKWSHSRQRLFGA